jgi:hypothetical protein
MMMLLLVTLVVLRAELERDRKGDRGHSGNG